nr:uncharacterized protein LOC111419095 [Onthophagus taurus]
MEWSNELTLEFLKFYEIENIIWNPKNPNHKNRNKVADAWNNIKASLRVDCSVAELKKKKESLMATFRPLLKKVRSSYKSGAGTGELYKPNWFAYEAMANFLQPVNLPRETINTSIDEETSNNDADEDIDVLLTAPSQSPNTTPKTKRLKTTPMSTDAIETHLLEAVNVMKHVSNKQEKDGCSLYGELLASKLRGLDEYNRIILMNKIDNLVFETTMSINPDRVFNSPTPSQLSICSSNSSSSNTRHQEYQLNEQVQHSQYPQFTTQPIPSQQLAHNSHPSIPIQSQTYPPQQSSLIHSPNYDVQPSLAS